MGPTWGPPEDDRTRVGPMLATWTLLSGIACTSGDRPGPKGEYYEFNLLERHLCICLLDHKKSSLTIFYTIPRKILLYKFYWYHTLNSGVCHYQGHPFNAISTFNNFLNKFLSIKVVSANTDLFSMFIQAVHLEHISTVDIDVVSLFGIICSTVGWVLSRDQQSHKITSKMFKLESHVTIHWKNSIPH